MELIKFAPYSRISLPDFRKPSEIPQSQISLGVTMAMLTQTIVTPTVTYTQPLGLFIDGKWVKSAKGKVFETINPTNEETITAVHEAGPEGERWI